MPGMKTLGFIFVMAFGQLGLREDKEQSLRFFLLRCCA
jgi:hypothetical protein